MEFTFLTKPVKRRQFLHSVATEFSNCKMSFTPNLLQKLLFSPKPLVSLLGGCGGYPPNRTLPLFFTYFHYHCLKGGPGGLPLVISLYLLHQFTKPQYRYSHPFFPSPLKYPSLGGVPPILLYILLFYLLPLLFPGPGGLPLVNSLFLLFQFTKP